MHYFRQKTRNDGWKETNRKNEGKGEEENYEKNKWKERQEKVSEKDKKGDGRWKEAIVREEKHASLRE